MSVIIRRFYGTVTVTIPGGAIPDAVAVNPVTGAAYVTNFGSNTVSVISGSAVPRWEG